MLSQWFESCLQKTKYVTKILQDKTKSRHHYRSWTSAPTPGCQQPDATLWLLHQHPVNQRSLICFWREVPWSLGFLRDVRVCAECACLCTQLPRCVHINNKSLKDTHREKWFVVSGYLEITKQDFSWQNMVCFLLCPGNFCCQEVVN